MISHTRQRKKEFRVINDWKLLTTQFGNLETTEIEEAEFRLCSNNTHFIQ